MVYFNVYKTSWPLLLLEVFQIDCEYIVKPKGLEKAVYRIFRYSSRKLEYQICPLVGLDRLSLTR